MNETSHQRLLDVIPLAIGLDERELGELAAEFPEFDVPALLEEASTMGAANAGPEGDPILRRRGIQLQLQLGRRATDRSVPECERAWRRVRGKLRIAARLEFAAALLGLAGGGSAAGGTLMKQFLPAIVGGIVALFASILTLSSQSVRSALGDKTNLAAVYATLAESRGQLLEVQDEIRIWLKQSNEMLLANEEHISDCLKRAHELRDKIGSAVSSTG
jgi:hypothetical protein